MSRIKTTEELYQAMCLDGIESVEALENMRKLPMR